MQVKIKIDKAFEDLQIHICHYEMTKEVKALAKDVSDFVNEKILGTDSCGNKVVLRPQEMIRFFAQDKKVYAKDEQGCYSVREKLYELEKMLDTERFIRVSKSEIVNIRKIKKLDMNMVGTIKIVFVDGTETYTSRRNVTNLKKKLGIV